MAIYRYPFHAEAYVADANVELTAAIRAPLHIWKDPNKGDLMVEWTVALTTTEQTTATTTVDDVVRAARARVLGIKTVADFRAAKTDLSALYQFTQRTKAQYLALDPKTTMAAANYDVISAISHIVGFLVDPVLYTPPPVSVPVAGRLEVIPTARRERVRARRSKSPEPPP